MTYAPFARQSVGTDYRGYSAERALNWYARAWPDGATGQLMLQPTPGLTAKRNVGAGQIRAMMPLGAFLYICAGAKLWRLNVNNNVLTEIGAIQDAAETTMATTGTDVAVAVGGELYVYQTDTGDFGPVSVPSLLGVGTIAAADGYYIATALNGPRFAYSAINDATEWNALDYFAAESAPDRLERVATPFQELWLFGSATTEVWSVVGGSSVLRRNPGGTMDVGIRWPTSAVAMDDAILWVGDDGIVYRARGYQPQRVSTEGLEKILEGYTPDQSLYFFTYTHEGHEFYCIVFPDRPAWCLDLNTGLWHERNSGADRTNPWAVQAAVSNRNVVYLGTRSGKVCTLGGLTDDGETIAREAVSAPLVQGDEFITVRRMTAYFQTGKTDILREARVALECRRRSYDDWRTWGNERWRSLGSVGEDRVARWHALGRAKGWQFRMRITDPIETALYGVSLDVAG